MLGWNKRRKSNKESAAIWHIRRQFLAGRTCLVCLPAAVSSLEAKAEHKDLP